MSTRLLVLTAIAVLSLAASGWAAQFEDLNAVLGMPGSVGAAWGDYDGDGDADLFLPAASPAAADPLSHGPLLYRNDGGLSFTEVSASLGFSSTPMEQDGAAWGDYDNDGDLDLLVGSGAGYPLLFHREADGFTDVASSAGFHVEFSAGRSVNWCDYDGDNLLDAFCSNIFGRGYLMHNNGDGTFTETAEASGLWPCDAAQSASWGDFDNDGWPDLAIARLGQPTLLFHNEGDGTFAEASVGSGLSAFVDAYSAIWGDYDSDGWLDCYLTSANYIEPQTRRDALFHNNADGSFTDVSGTAGMAGDASVGLGAAWADYDNDGWLDLFVGNLEGDNQAFLYHNDGDGTFTEVAAESGMAGSVPGQAAAWADPDEDGSMDLFQAVAGPASRFFHNTGLAGNWLRVRAMTRGSGASEDVARPARDAIGARVEVNLDNDDAFPYAGRTLTRLIDGGSGFCGQNEQVAQFGLGASDLAAVRVTFPTGHVMVRRDVAANGQVVLDDVAGFVGTVAGSVTEAVSGDPIAGAQVAAGAYTTATEEDGAYHLRYVPEGLYTVTATAVGYRSAQVAAVEVVRETTAVVDFALARAYGTIAGVVRDGGSLTPVAGATVTCDDRTQVTGAGGLFQFAALWVGEEHTVSVLAPTYQAAVRTGITVTDGGTTSVTIDLTPSPGSIAGQVTDASATSASPIAGATVSCRGRSTTTDVDGNYLLTDVPAGSDQTLTVTAEWFVTATVSGIAVLPEQTATVDVAMTPATGSLEGAVRDAVTEEPIPNATITCQGKAALTDALGSYTIADLRAGPGNSVTASATFYIARTVTGVTVAAETPTQLDILLSVESLDTILFASTPGIDGVQLAPSLFSSDATSALATIDDGAWQPAVGCAHSGNWPWQSDTTPPYATWISNTYLVETTGNDSWRWFHRVFTLPAGSAVHSGTITWTADNAGFVYVNRQAIGSDGEVFGTYHDTEEFRIIKTFHVAGSLLHEGENEILFLVRNYGLQTSNPTGLIYEMSVSGQGVWTNFPDVPPDHWAYDAVMACFQAGVVKGYPDGLYHPGDSVKRSQMAVFMARALARGDAQVPTGPAVATFSDVSSDGYGEDGTQPYWAYRYIEYCADHDIVQGYWDGSYHPEEIVNRGQMAVYVARAMAGGEAGVPEPAGSPSFRDVPADHWAYRYVEYAGAAGVVQGYWDGTYHPERDVTRDQMAVYVARAFDLE